MDRYCLETDIQQKKFIVHNQRCALYHDAHLLRMNLAQDLGEYAQQQKALKKARELAPAVQACSACLQSLDA